MADESRSTKKGPARPSEAPPRHVTRHVQPLGPRVLVRVLPTPSRLESGLYLPEGAKDAHVEALLGLVVEVARTAPSSTSFETELDEDEPGNEPGLGENVSGVPLGAKVLFGKDKGVVIPWDDTLRLVDVRHILAVVEEIPEESIQ